LKERIAEMISPIVAHPVGKTAYLQNLQLPTTEDRNALFKNIGKMGYSEPLSLCRTITTRTTRIQTISQVAPYEQIFFYRLNLIKASTCQGEINVMQKNTLVRKFMTLCLRKTAVFSFILCVSAVFGILGTLPQAQALSICHGDPIVTLSNGIKVQATVSISADPTRLGNLHVAYTFHIPVGVSVEKITYTGGSLAGRENVQVYADQISNSYSEQVLATASYSVIVTTTTAYKGQSVTVTGMTNQSILITPTLMSSTT